MFTVTVVGTNEVSARITEVIKATPALAGKAMYDEAQDIMAESAKLCPRDTGTLVNSGIVQLPVYDMGNVSVTLGYGGAAAPYALSVHENPRAGKTGGLSPSGRKYKHWAQVGQWKYLEQPFLAAAKGIAERIAARIGIALQQTSGRLSALPTGANAGDYVHVSAYTTKAGVQVAEYWRRK